MAKKMMAKEPPMAMKGKTKKPMKKKAMPKAKGKKM